MCRCAATVIEELERQLNLKLFICHQKKKKKKNRSMKIRANLHCAVDERHFEYTKGVNVLPLNKYLKELN